MHNCLVMCQVASDSCPLLLLAEFMHSCAAAMSAAARRSVPHMARAVDPEPQRTRLSPGDQCVSKLLCSAVPKATAA